MYLHVASRAMNQSNSDLEHVISSQVASLEGWWDAVGKRYIGP